ncbi:DUF4870 domain-containing protein [Luteimonas deserti]|uniref:DUF4870 domain-containing protein n=1 Tax=Luteimonas deserti TaxID=2752306 RepID=A0A7Z0QPV2_9GAMM|nr:DUF4870 domain-containing protein [Luteimonas deserti]NYZ62622.1 DUF4870 domain-containing protein [Luteimonas deserti]
MSTTPVPLHTVSDSERQWAAGVHVGALVLALLTSWVSGAAGAAVAGVVYLVKRDHSRFAAAHAREALNFNISMFLYACALGVLGVVLLGATVLTLGLGVLVTLPLGLVLVAAACALALAWLVCSIVAAIRAWHGEMYRYPLTIRLIRG